MSTLTDLEKSKDKTNRIISLHDQIQNIPEAQKQEDMEAYASGDLTPKTLQEKWLSEGHLSREYHAATFKQAINAFGFKQREYQSHGFLAESEEHMRLWDWAKNEKEGLNPEELTLGSGKQAWFKCSDKIHNSEKRIIRDHIRGYGCSKCRDEANGEARSTPTKGVNDLATVRPDLIKYWSDRNEKRPDEVCYGAKEKFWWVDKDGNEYINTPNNRVKKPTDWSPLHYWRDECPDHYEVYQYIRSIVPEQYPVLVEQKMLPESKEMTDKGYKQSLFVDIVVWIGPFKLLFEVNGSEHFSYGKRYHDRKIEAAAELGHTLTHVWSHIWIMETQKCMDEIKNQIDFVLSYQTGTRGNQMVARKPVQLDGDVVYRSDSK